MLLDNSWQAGTPTNSWHGWRPRLREARVVDALDLASLSPLEAS